MRRRSHLAVGFVALLAVGWNVVSTQPGGSALAADPEAQLAETRAQLANAQATQASLAATLSAQRAQLQTLQERSAALDVQLNVARAELEAVTAEFNRVSGLLAEVRTQVTAIEAHLVDLRAQIRTLDREMSAVAVDILRRSRDLEDRQELLEEHLRSAYERSQTSLLEVLLSADSLDEATTQVGYLMSISDQDTAIAENIRTIREELETRRATLREGRAALADARTVAREEERVLKQRREELTALEAQLAALREAAAQKEVEQEAALNAALQAKGDVETQIAANEQAAAAASRLAAQLQQQAAAQQAAIEEARRRAAEEARRRAAAEAAARPSAYGFRWPERSFQVTQEWGPTAFVLEPPYTYGGTYYPHFHAGIDFSAGCGTPVYAAGAGVVVASGQPLLPFDTGFGVVVDHGGGILTWYWHLQPTVVVGPGTIVTSESTIGFEGSTGMSTGCHVHFAVNHNNVWENPRAYLP
jgi:murein DD-endopeptidase MepM/ murein hydrolase activator NlpD